jgi:hypothetical protein
MRLQGDAEAAVQSVTRALGAAPPNLNPNISELAAMSDEQAEKLVERSRARR